MADRVVVAMSGGVDSSVAAALLVEQGYEVIGVMLRLWVDPTPRPLAADLVRSDGAEPAERTNRCCSVEAIHDARGVAVRLGIPFYVIDAAQRFKTHVVDRFIAAYAAGQTPNPCLWCNRTIRFGHLLDYARALGARYLATGHYARREVDTDGRLSLWRGVDRTKDQSYVLSVLGPDELAATLFPVGDFTKPQVRALAAARGLPTASRADSQDLCFIGHGDYRRFLADYAPEAMRPGPIIDPAGRVMGQHHGLPGYTIGQRSGLGIAAAEPLYVIALDLAHNALLVGPAAALGQDSLETDTAHWVDGAAPSAPFEAEVQIRYHATAQPARVTPRPDGGLHIAFTAPLRDITPGQAAVVYQGERCLGGGLIIRVPDMKTGG